MKRKTEKEGEESRLPYREIVENMAEGVFLIRASDGVIVYANPAQERIFGYAAGELIGKKVSAVNAPTNKSPEEVAGEIIDNLNLYGVWQGEVQNIKKDGTIFWCQANVSTFEHPRHGKVWISIHQDITARMHAEEALKNSEQKYRLLFESAGDAIFIHDQKGRMLAVNPAACARFGYTHAELVSLTVDQVDTPEEAPYAPERIAQLMRRGYHSFETVHQRKDGSPVPTEVSARFIIWDGQPAMMSICRDITERKQAEQALKDSENLYRKMNENSPLGMHFYNLNADNQLIFTDANPAADRLLRVDNAQFIGKTLEAAFPALAQTEVPRRYRDAAAKGISWETEQITYADNRIVGAFEVSAFQTTPGNMVAIFADSTERKQMEEALRESEERYRSIYQDTALGIFHSTFEGRFIDVNPALAKMLGYDSPQAVVDSIHSIADQIYALPPKRDEIISEALRQGQTVIAENRYRRKNGEEWEARLHLRYIMDGQGKPLYLEGFVEDFTEHKRMEDALREREARLKTVTENTPDTILQVDQHGLITFVNRLIPGLTLAEVVGSSVYKWVPEEQYPILARTFDTVFSTGECGEYESEGPSPDGEKRIYHVRVMPVIMDGKTNSAIYTATDVTERKRVEEKLCESEERYRQLVELSPDLIAIHQNEKIVFINQSGGRLLGAASPDQIIGKLVSEFIPPERGEISRERIQRLLEEGKSPVYEQRMRRLDGVELEVEVQGLRFNYQGQPAVQVVARDITERRLAEKALRASEEKYRTVANFTYDWEAWRAPDGSYLYVSPSCERITGHTVAEFMSNSNFILQIAHPDDRQKVVAHHEAVAHQSQQENIVLDFRVVTAKGETRWLEHSCVAVYAENGQWLGQRESNRDITERKQAEENLRAISVELQTIYDNMYTLQAYLDRNFNFIRVNRAYAQADKKQPDFFIGKNHFDLYPNAENEAIFRRVVETGQPYIATAKPFEYPEHPEWGVTYWDWMLVPVFVEDQTISGLIFTLLDVTERKQAEEALRESEKRAQAMFRAIPDLMFRMNRQGVFLDYKADINDLYTPFDIIGKRNRDITPPEFADLIDRQIRITLETGALQVFEYQLPIPGHGLRSYEARMAVSGADEVTAIVRDITERKQIETALIESENRLRTIVESEPECVKLVDANGKLLDMNPAGLAMIEADSLEQVSGASIFNLVVPECQAAFKALNKRIFAGESGTLEFEIVGLKGSRRVMETHAAPLRNAQGTITSLLGVTRDITERKQAEEKLKDANASLEDQLGQIKILRDYLREQATRDPLTGLYNRRYLHETLERELARADREQYPISVMMMDIDHFKDLNDKYGHQAGDEVLITLGNLLRTSIRQGDIACRYGGEEFIVIMPGADHADAERRAETFRQNFGVTSTAYGGAELFATISIGVAFYPEDGGGMNEIIKAADTALYAAKQAGRNCIRLWQASRVR